MQAEASVQSLRDITSLRDAASALVDAATSIGCYHLVAVNAAAEPLTTAAALLSNGKLACSDTQHSTVDKVLIVDAATVTGNLTRSCAAYLRENGASWVGAIIYDRVRPDLDELDNELTIDFLTSLRSVEE
jgi:hypothetical protein